MSETSFAVATAVELAGQIVDSPDDDDRLRLCIGWVTELTQLAEIDRDDADAHVVERPPGTGDRRWDAMIAGLVEHLASHDQLTPPPWTHDEDRFLHVLWFPVDLPSVRVDAIRDAPAALARRAVFLDRRDLERV